MKRRCSFTPEGAGNLWGPQQQVSPAFTEHSPQRLWTQDLCSSRMSFPILPLESDPDPQLEALPLVSFLVFPSPLPPLPLPFPEASEPEPLPLPLPFSLLGGSFGGFLPEGTATATS